MQTLFSRHFAIALLLALTAFATLRGVVPALTRVDSDFPNYFTAATIVADGSDVTRLYDDAWFQEQMRRTGIGVPSQGRFAPFPPPTALLLLPLTRFDALTALRIVTVASLLGLAGSIVLLAKILRWEIVNSAAFVLLSGFAVANCLRLGQIYIFVSLSCIAAYYFYTRSKPVLGGLCAGLFLPIKYFPIVLVVSALLARHWKFVLGAVIGGLGIVVISLSVLGWELHEKFIATVLGDHLTANLSMQNPFTSSFQSFDTLFRGLFVFDAQANASPAFADPRLYVVGLIATKAILVAVATATLAKISRRNVSLPVAPALGLLGILVLLIAPATASYHFVLLWLPVALSIDYMLRDKAPRHAGLLLGAYAAIGFFPYRLTNPFEGRGLLTILAYPRLLLLAAMFSICVHFIWKVADRATRTEDAQHSL